MFDSADKQGKATHGTSAMMQGRARCRRHLPPPMCNDAEVTYSAQSLDCAGGDKQAVAGDEKSRIKVCVRKSARVRLCRGKQQQVQQVHPACDLP